MLVYTATWHREGQIANMVYVRPKLGFGAYLTGERKIMTLLKDYRSNNYSLVYANNL